MKVVCINNKWYGERLTICKTYEVINKTEYYYQIVDNAYQKSWWNKKWFKNSSEVRNETINKLLE